MSPETPPQPQVDSLAPATPAPGAASPSPVTPPKAAIQKSKNMLILLFGLPYFAFMCWAAALMTILPDLDGKMKDLVAAGTTSGMIAGATFVGIGMIALQRISASNLLVNQRQKSLIKIVLILLPGVIMAGALPIAITREPTLYLDIVDPVKAEDFVAPLPITFSAERAQATLARLGKKAISYTWDSNGDGKPDEETPVPTLIKTFDNFGVYVVVLRINLQGGDSRKVSRRITIPRAVFSVTPAQPIIERPVELSVADLIPDKVEIKDVTWNFGDDSEPKIETTAKTTHTYFTPGDYPVSAVLQLSNATQVRLERVLKVIEPPPLPFPVKIITTPKLLIGSAPFGVIMKVVTATPVKEIKWDYGDKKVEGGASLFTVSHAYPQTGVYPVVTKVRSQSGQLAEITTIIRVTDQLQLGDLSFDSTPGVKDGKVTGEVPLEVSIRPKTNQPLVHFTWDLPDDSPLQAVDDVLSGTLREPMELTLNMIAQDSENRILRYPITITAKPPQAQAQIDVHPEGGNAPLKVLFDASQSFIPADQNVAGFRWSFGDDIRQQDSFELGGSRIEHIYTRPGEFIVKLAIRLVSGAEYTAERHIIVRKPDLKSCFVPSRLTVQVGKGVDLDSSCAVGTIKTYLWDIRYDAQADVTLAQSSQARYAYVFNQPGTYTVRLTVTDEFQAIDTSSVVITVTE